MAVATSPASKQKLSSPKSKKVDITNKDPMIEKQPETDCPKPAKRTKAPGVRVVHGRIYDSQNGKTCHQCRQKTLDFSADCKDHRKDKQCTLKFCHTCLLNRYGEKAEEMALLADWSCPRCRGICNCSFCMKKRGHQPTGMLVRTAKASGFSSVSDLLHVKGSEIIGPYKCAKEVGASPRKLAATSEETKIASPRKLGKENLIEGNTDLSMTLSLASSPAKEKTKKMKKRLKEIHDVNGDNALLKESGSTHTGKKRKNMEHEGSKATTDSALQKEVSPHPDEKKLKKKKLEMPKEMLDAEGDSLAHLKEATCKSPRATGGNRKEAKPVEKADGVRQEEKVLKKTIHREVDDTNNIHKDVEVLDSGNEVQFKVVTESYKLIMNPLDAHVKCVDDDIPLPTGTELTTVAGIDLPAQDVGDALQFLEFCAAFGKILDVKRGQAEAVLRELLNGRNTRRGKYSLVIQFHIQLLSVIQKDSGSPPLSPTDGKDSWLSSLKECVKESYCSLDSLPLDCLDRNSDGYDSLDSSVKLRLLNFLCDEVLETAELRTWIENQNSKFSEETKEAKARVTAAKHKKKLLHQKIQDDVAKSVIAKNGAPLSISEHEAIVSQIKHEVAEAHAELLDCKSIVTKDKQISEAVRTEAVHLDSNGRAYWRLKGYSDKLEILGQDIGTRDEVQPGEKWFAYDAEQTNAIEKRIKSLRERRTRRKIQFQTMALPLYNEHELTCQESMGLKLFDLIQD